MEATFSYVTLFGSMVLMPNLNTCVYNKIGMAMRTVGEDVL